MRAPRRLSNLLGKYLPAASVFVACGPGERPPPPPPTEPPPKWVSEMKCDPPLVRYSEEVRTHEERHRGEFQATFRYPVLDTPWRRDVAQTLNPRIEAWLASTRDHLMQRIVDTGYWELRASCEVSAPAPRCTRFLTVLCSELLISGGMRRPQRTTMALPVRLDTPELRTFGLVHLCRPDVDCFSGLASALQRHADRRLAFVSSGDSAVSGRYTVRIDDLRFEEFALRPEGLRVDLSNYLPAESGSAAIVDIPVKALRSIFRPDVLADFQ